MNSNHHGQEVLALIEQAHAGTAALAASLPRGAVWGLGPDPAPDDPEQVAAPAAGDGRDAPPSVEDATRSAAEMGITEA